MGFFDSMFAGATNSNGFAHAAPDDEYWYVGRDGTVNGVTVSPDAARKLSAWYRGRDLLCTALAMLPLHLYRKLPDDMGAETATDHPLYDVLHDEPNSWQDSFMWRRMKMGHLIDHGNSYDLIKDGRRGFVDQLEPFEQPTRVTPEQLSSKRVVYHTRDVKTGQPKIYTQDEIFHLMGASDDGIVGKGVLQFARENLGTGLFTESYASRLFSKGTLNGGIIETPAVLNPDASKRMAESFVTAAGNWHLPKVLEQGAKYNAPTISPKDFEMVTSRQHTVDDIARWLGVPRHMLENSDPSFGNAEQFNQNFVTFSLGPWLSLWEFAIKRQLILAKGKYYAEFKREALARGTLKDRWEKHVASVNAGIESVDEVRGIENLNKRGGKSNELREPQNIVGKPKVGGAEPRDEEEEQQPEPKKKPAGNQARSIAIEAAARLLRKEVKAVQQCEADHRGDADGYAAAITAFYAEHAGLVASTLAVPLADAEGYCASQASKALAGRAGVHGWTSPSYAAEIASWALNEGVAA